MTEIKHEVAPVRAATGRKRDVNMLSSQARLKRMLEGERQIRSCRDHVVLANTAISNFQNFTWRERVTQWCYDVADHLNESRELVYVAMNMLDRYIAVTSAEAFSSDKVAYELAAITSLFLAIRVSGSNTLEVPDLLQMSRAGVQVKDIVSTGTAMLEALSWEHKLITPTDFIKAMLSTTHASMEHSKAVSILELSSYMVEISVCDQYFIGVPSSKVAFASMINVLNRNDLDAGVTSSQFFQCIHQATGMSPHSPEIKAIAARMKAVYSQSEESADTNGPHLISDFDDDESSQVAPPSSSFQLRPDFQIITCETHYVSDSQSSCVVVHQHPMTPCSEGAASKRARLN
jgi:hypothetical protein